MADDPIYGPGGPPKPGQRPRFAVVRGGTGPSPLWVDEDAWVEADIPVRPWIVPGYLMEGAVSMLAGAGAAGKSMLSLGYAVSLATGRPFGRFKPRGPARVAVFNVEDDLNEQRRRLSACLRQFDLTPRDIAKHVLRIGVRETGCLLEYDPATGLAHETRTMVELLARVDAFGAKLLVLDPFVELHTAPENDNQALRAVVAYFRTIAQERQIAMLLNHHTRKGPQGPGDADMARGASAILGAVRVAHTVCCMSEDDAEKLGVKAETRGSFFRVDAAKSNYVALDAAEWFERAEYELDNGELTAAALPWLPPTQKHVSQHDLNAIAARLAAGHDGDPWSPKLDSQPRSVRQLLVEFGIHAPSSQKAAIQQLKRDYGVVERSFRSKEYKERRGLQTANGLPDAEWFSAG